MKNNKPNQNGTIRDVYRQTFVSEMKQVSRLLKRYNYIGMDTEFPGTLYSTNLNSYKAIKSNVESLKLIQVGITLSDRQGNKPEECASWQFNLQFSLKTDKHSLDSINMLTTCGIDFNELEKEGISHEIFAEHFLSSGLALNEDVKWICFHGIYDFAYLLHTITNLPLPDTEAGFFDDLKIYFPCFYDIRYLIRFNESLKGSLSKLAQDLNVKRYGAQHQAGSDSLLTLEVFIKLYQDEYLSEVYTYNERNALFGISPDDPNSVDQMSLSKFKSTPSLGSSNINTTTTTQPQVSFDYNTYYQMNNQSTIPTMNQMNMNNVSNGGMQYNYLRNNNNNYYIPSTNSYYPYNMGMQYQMMNPTDNSCAPSLTEQRKKTKKGEMDD